MDPEGLFSAASGTGTEISYPNLDGIPTIRDRNKYQPITNTSWNLEARQRFYESYLEDMLTVTPPTEYQKCVAKCIQKVELGIATNAMLTEIMLKGVKQAGSKVVPFVGVASFTYDSYLVSECICNECSGL